MEITLELWYLFPTSIAIATIAMASGVGGAIFFSPLFILVLGLDAQIAIGTALFTELFGFSSGLYAYKKNKLIDYELGKKMLKVSVPMAILGAIASSYISSNILKGIFAVGIIYIGIQIFLAWRKEEREEKINKGPIDENTHETRLIDSDNNVYQYTIRNKTEGRFVAAIGGLFVGMISVGLGELMDYHLVSRCKVPTRVAVATAVFCVVITVLVASMGHFYEFFFHSPDGTIQEVLSVAMFTVPGVLIGGQLGPQVQKKIHESYLKGGLSVLFVCVGILMAFALIVSL